MNEKDNDIILQNKQNYNNNNNSVLKKEANNIEEISKNKSIKNCNNKKEDEKSKSNKIIPNNVIQNTPNILNHFMEFNVVNQIKNKINIKY